VLPCQPAGRLARVNPDAMSLRCGFSRRSSSSSSSSSAAAPKAAKSAWFEGQFDTFADESDGSIGPEGVEKLCKNLEVDPADVLVLVLAWQLEASQMGYFSREEWMRGAERGLSAATSMAELKGLLQTKNTAIRQGGRAADEQLRSLHAFTHKFCREERKKNIDVSAATTMLELVHGSTFPKHIPSLCEYLNQHKEVGKRGVSADEWSMVLNFCNEIVPDCSNFQDDGAWPLLLDDYVEWYREKENK